MTSDDILWCCHVYGPDDVIPMRDHAAAVSWASDMNAYFANIPPHPFNPTVSVAVEPWPLSAEGHAEHLARDEAEEAARQAKLTAA